MGEYVLITYTIKLTLTFIYLFCNFTRAYDFILGCLISAEQGFIVAKSPEINELLSVKLTVTQLATVSPAPNTDNNC